MIEAEYSLREVDFKQIETACKNIVLTHWLTFLFYYHMRRSILLRFENELIYDMSSKLKSNLKKIDEVYNPIRMHVINDAVFHTCTQTRLLRSIRYKLHVL